jgi:predicted RNA-binding Zn ribbon-like protein
VTAKRNAETFRLVGGHQALDLVNTVAPRRAAHTFEPADALTDTTDLLIWARRTGVVTEVVAASVTAAWQADLASAARAPHVAVELREAAYAVLASRLGLVGAPEPGPALDRIARRWSAATARCRLAPDGVATAARLVIGTVPALLIPDRLAFATVDLLSAVDLGRLRTCPVEEGGCGWLFLDHSRSGSRRWCAMEDCGSQAKARRLTARRRASRATVA